jgi:hypothetical protein
MARTTRRNAMLAARQCRYLLEEDFMRGHALVAAAGLLAALTVTHAQQEKPNFSGRWVLVSPAGSAGQEQVVTQDATTLTTAHASSGHGHRSVYKLDGTESRNGIVSHGSEISTLSKASWNASQLTIESDTVYPDGRKRRATTVWSLDGDGRLVLELTESGPNGPPSTTKLIYVRR